MISILLIFVFTFNIGGSLLVYGALRFKIKSEIKKQIENGIDTTELNSIEINSETNCKIQWVEDNKEFKYNGEMYDVVSVKVSGGKKYLQCINDKKENNLIANFVVNKELAKKIKRVLKFLNMTYISKNINWLDVVVKQEQIAATQFFQYFYVLNVPHPPPEFPDNK